MIEIKDKGVPIFFYFKMNYFVYTCVRRERWYVPKYTIAYSHGGMVKNLNFLRIELMKGSLPKRLTNKLAKHIKTSYLN